jgi:nicotinamidase-related amidase
MSAAATLDPARTLLVVIDLQEKLLPAIPAAPRVVANSVLLLRLAQTLELPVVLTSQYARGLGAVVPEIAAEAPRGEILDKTSFGCFGDAAFRERLSAHADRRQLLVAGIESHICVTQTVLGALQQGFEVHVAADAAGSRAEENHRTGLRRMERAGAVLSSTEMAAYELLQRSDTPAFKKMLPLFRK